MKEMAWFILGLLGAQFLFYYTISISNAPTATILQYQAPVFVLLWQAFLKRRLPEGRELLGVALALAGVFLISTHGDPGHLVISPLALLTGELSGIGLAIYTVMPVNLLKRFSITLIMGWGQLFSSLFLLPFCSLADSGIRSWDIVSAGAVLFIILGGTVLPFSLFLVGVQVIGPARASLISCFEPLASVVFAVVLLGTVLLPPDYAGMTCIMITVIMLAAQRNT